MAKNDDFVVSNRSCYSSCLVESISIYVVFQLTVRHYGESDDSNPIARLRDHPTRSPACWHDRVPMQVVFSHPTLHSCPHVSPIPALLLTSPSDPKRCPAEFSLLPPTIVYRTIVLMQDTLNSTITQTQSRTQNEQGWYTTLQNITQCYIVTRGPPDETMRLVSPDCHPTEGTGFRSIPSAQRFGIRSAQASIQGRLLDRTT